MHYAPPRYVAMIMKTVGNHAFGQMTALTSRISPSSLRAHDSTLHGRWLGLSSRAEPRVLASGYK